MSGLISYSELQQSAPLPVAIDYPAALALRQMALIQGKLPIQCINRFLLLNQHTAARIPHDKRRTFCCVRH